MNGDTKKNLALGAIALGIGVALGAILNDKTKQLFVDRGKGIINRLVDRSKGLINRFVDRSKEFAHNNPAERTRRSAQTRHGRRRRVLHA